MGLFNHLFGDKGSIAKELKIDSERRIQIWGRALKDYEGISELSKYFSPNNIEKALQDLDALDEVLDNIASLISKELIDIGDEEKLEHEILGDLRRLTSEESKEHTHILIRTIAIEHHDQKKLIPIFRKIHDTLKLAIHTINLIKKRPDNIGELLNYLFKLLFHQLGFLYNTFNRESFIDESVGDKINHIARAIILEEELKEEEQSAENKFVSGIVDQIGNDSSEHYYRRLGKHIFSRLAEMAGLPLKDDDAFYGWIEGFEGYLYDDEVLSSIIREFHRKSDDQELQLIMIAFRKSYHFDHFNEFIHSLLQS
ncbi:hypothetical protein CMO83_01480 [Candidatus Woesearchaeota archaeon]|jgi:hypothetical protein|nr:hypothetical protein [Candidatus Woesearchaeota archaeon]MDP6647984.1 hypothetical protein [Candidatus Woesearchaeota archaeon]|tara:strand:- start:23841 stop:24776 length:936 start_codon:yes stop_codon:yes gene_type:complete